MNRKAVLFASVYLVTVYYIASLLSKLIDRIDTSKHGGECVEIHFFLQ